MQQLTQPTRRRGRSWRFDWSVLLVYGTFVPAVAAGLTGGPESPWSMIAVGLLFQLATVAGVVFAARAGWHPALDARTRRAWRTICAALILLAASQIARVVQPPAETGTFPSPGDVLRLGFVPVLLVGLALLPLRAQSRQDRHKIWLDTGIVIAAAGMLLWTVNVEPAIRGNVSGQALAAMLAYPVGDLALIFGAALVLLRGAASSVRRPLTALVAGLLCLTMGDLYMGRQVIRPGELIPEPWQTTCWLVGIMLLCVAGYEQCRQAGGHRLSYSEKPLRPVTLLPYVAVAFGYVLLVFTTWRLQLFQMSGLVFGAVVLTALVVGRQVVAQRETHAIAVTDPLTGLVNRKRLQDALSLALTRSARSGQQVAAMLVDMNGFKQVNDNLGHDAGDQLLVAFAQILHRNVLGADVVGRLGGDEFAVILHNIGSAANAVAVAKRITADTRHPVLLGDTPVAPSASIGIAIAGPGELLPDELMRRADMAMYRAKQAKMTGFELYREHLAQHQAP
jgi:diguanylate cyclase (GGDEF)-like protein